MMNGRKLVAIIVSFAMCVALFAGCGEKTVKPDGQESTINSESENVTAAEQDETPKHDEEQDKSEDQNQGEDQITDEVHKLSAMTTREKVCQMIMPAIRKWSDTPDVADSYIKVESLNKELRAFLSEYNLGGICLFSENCTGTEQLALLTSDLQAAAFATKTGIPMFLSIDQEGGYITRLATGTSGTGNMAIAATGVTETARISAGIIGEELAALGVTMNFGPDSDVNNNPDNPVIGIRSFCDNPDVVADFARSYVQGLHDNGIISCLKHFPGHGDTATDSHVGFPYIDKSLSELDDVELVPFRALANDADMMMTAHIQFPQIETETYTSITTGEKVYLPATLSKTIITDILRNDIGFDGVVTTDALDMAAISENFDPLDAAKLAIAADVDILLMPVTIQDTTGLENLKKYIDAIVTAVESGEIDEAQIDNSVERILKLKEKYQLSPCFGEDIDAKIEAALATVGSKAHHDKEWELALEAVTLYRRVNQGECLIDADTRFLVFCPYDSHVNSVEFARQKLCEDGMQLDPDNLTVISYDGIANDVSAEYEDAIAAADVVVLISKASSVTMLDLENPDNIIAHFCNSIINAANDAGKETILISSQLPYDAHAYNAKQVFLCYNPSGMSEIPTEYKGETKKYGPNVPAAIYIALSGKEAEGHSPVDIY